MKVLFIGMILVVSACAGASDSPTETHAFTAEDVSRIRTAVLSSADLQAVDNRAAYGNSISILRARVDQFGGSEAVLSSNQEILRQRIDEFGR